MPPNLEPMREDPVATPNQIIKSVLDSMPGLACLVDSNGQVLAVGAGWDQLVQRAECADWSAATVQKGTVFDLLPEDANRSAFRKAFDSLFKGDRKQISQSVELGSEQKPLAINLVCRLLRTEEDACLCLVHGQDVTAEYISRLALLDRERKLKEARDFAPKQTAEIAALSKQQNDLEQTLAERDSIAEQLQANMAELLETAKRQAAEIERLQAELSERDSAIASLKSGSSEQAAEHAELAEMTKRQAAEIERLQTELSERDSAITNLNSTLAQHANEIAAMSASAAAGADEIAGLYDQLKQVTAAAEAPTEIPAVHNLQSLRVLAGGLADDFGNLLTGVLGHSSLAAAEIGESHAASNDVRAIERSARNAARLIRRLAAMCGTARRHGTPLDLLSYLKTYATRDRADYFPAGAALLDLQCDMCFANADAAAMEIIFDGMAEHARRCGNGDAAPLWSLGMCGDAVCVKLSFGGVAAPPPGWTDESLAGLTRAQVADLLFAREAARTLGGDIEIRTAETRTEIALTIPGVDRGAEQDR